MTVLSSFPSTKIAPSENVNGTEMLRRFLEMAEREIDPRDIGRSAGSEINNFEHDIARRLRAAGATVYAQWGVSEYSIDIVVAHPKIPGQMVLAVEADGDRYHRSHSARDRDRLRHEHLERLGWRFCRVWASAWFADPDAETHKILMAWRAAVADYDARTDRTSSVVPPPKPRLPESPVAPAAIERGPYHHVPPGLATNAYTDRQLIAVCRWLISDGLALDREERIRQARTELGYKRKGAKIDERLIRAVDIAQHLADLAES